MRKRLICLTMAITLLFVSVASRTGYIAVCGDYTVGSGYNSYSLTLGRIMPTLYYRDMSRMTNNTTQYVAVIRPTAKCIGEISKIFNYDDQQSILADLKNGKPVARIVDGDIKTNHITIYKTFATKSKSQLISAQSRGLEYFLNDGYGTLTISYNVDALGRILTGDTGTLHYDNYDNKHGYVLTIDRNIQQITESVMSGIDCGSAIVMDVHSGALLACVSKPDTSYLNRAICRYAAGSVFKTVVAVSAMENAFDIQYDCAGKCMVGDTMFSCSHDAIHGHQNLQQAIANSCNCYFVNLALKLGAERLLATAGDLGFSAKTELYTGWMIDNASLPSEKSLAVKGQLALLGFGQGELLCTPLQMCSVMCAIGNGGIRPEPFLLKESVNGTGVTEKIAHPSGHKAMSAATAETMINYLRFAVTNGTGAYADTKASKSAGKTGTAQTGQYSADREKLNSWFAGIYPYDNPKYAILVMIEDGTSGSADCCPIFRTIVENIE